MGRHKGYKREEVLDKAMGLFWRKGYEGAHLQELVKETGLNRFSLYKEFGGKDGLYEEAINRYMRDFVELAALLKREPRGLGNILEYIHTLMQNDFSQGCFMVNTLTQQELVNEKIRTRVREFVATSENLMLDNLKAAQTRGEIRKDLNLDSLAKFLVVFDIGMVTYSLVNPTAEEKNRIEEILRELLSKGLEYPSGSKVVRFEPRRP
jgi:TetR/AcrR family transcriptional repressor of nem operon